MKNNLNLISGQLYPGETGSGKVVSELKEQAEKIEADVMIIDSAAGIGCPVIASIKDSDLAILVTEPTPSALVDLKRILEIVVYFKISYKIVINKWDINKNFSKKIENKFKSKILGKISYDQKIFQAVSDLKPIIKTDLRAKEEIINIFKRL